MTNEKACNTCAYRTLSIGQTPCFECLNEGKRRHWAIHPLVEDKDVNSTHTPASEAAPALTVPPSDTKSTNPKDVVGIRKAPMSTVPANVLAEVGVAMLEGSLKYGRHNYRTAGVRTSVYYDGTMRHLMAFWEGEDLDPDSGVSHVTKAIASLVVLRDAMLQGMITDDRPPCAKPFMTGLNEKAASLVDLHKDKSPRHYTIFDAGLVL